MTTQMVTFSPSEKHQSGEIYTDPSTGEASVLAKDMAITADGRAYQCFRLEPTKGMGHIRLPDQPPRILVDSHMHIQSGRCAPLPFLRSRMKGAPVDRSTIQDWGTGRLAGKFAPSMKKLAEESAGSTFEVGMSYVKKTEALHVEMRAKEPYDRAKALHVCGAIMTMDMEYAHVAGYFGLPIYNPLYASQEEQAMGEEPVAYWYPGEETSHQTGPVGSPEAEAYPEEGESLDEFKALKKQRRKEGILGSVHDASGQQTHSVPIHCQMKMAPKEEAVLYEGWKKQLRYTKQATVEGKLALLPMFHYDPRRWQRSDGIAFREVGAQGAFIGFKMYSAQGYRPWEPRLPKLAQFYARCEQEGIPILNHCTPEGASTYDRQKYIFFRHPNDTAEDDGQKDRCAEKYRAKAESAFSPPPGMSSNDPMYQRWAKEQKERIAASLAAEDYFNEHFVSPKAWRVVLNKHPKLRLCLAHFGGNTSLGREWGLEIIRMMEEKKFPNFYADLSYSFVYPDFREQFKKLLKEHPGIKDHVLFGTDWYMFLADGADLVDYCRTAKEFLDSIDKMLWPQFTEENPCRFYRLGGQIGRIAENLIKEKGAELNQEGKRSKIFNSDEARRKAEEANKGLQAYSNQVRNLAEILKTRALMVTR